MVVKRVERAAHAQEDRLCWMNEDAMDSHTTPWAPHCNRPGAPAGVTVFPSAIAALDGTLSGNATMQQAGGAAAATSGFYEYVPLDRLPVRSLPRGYEPGTAVCKVANTQLVAREHIGTAFSITAGSHTHFFAVASAAEADEWVAVIRQAWHLCTMYAQRSAALGGDQLDEVLVATQKRAQMERLLLCQEAAKREAEMQRALEVLRQRNEALTAESQRIASYQVSTVTSSTRGSGTDSRVYVEIFGEDGRSSGPQQLVWPSRAKQAVFRPGATDVFTVPGPNFGAVVALRIGQDASGGLKDWNLRSVHVRKQCGVAADGAPLLGPAVDFPAHYWLSPSKGERHLSVELLAGQLPGKVTRCAFRHVRAWKHVRARRGA